MRSLLSTRKRDKKNGPLPEVCRQIMRLYGEKVTAQKDLVVAASQLYHFFSRSSFVIREIFTVTLLRLRFHSIRSTESIPGMSLEKGKTVMMLASVAVIGGLLVLIWGADLFVEGSSVTARHLGVPPLLIGMVIVGFGTSAPEMVVSALAAMQGNPGLALGNAYGSNITNIALILGLTALISPMAVHSRVLRKELPILIAVTGLAAFQIRDGELTRIDAWILLGVLGGLMSWTIRQGLRQRVDALNGEPDPFFQLCIHL